jgi:RNA polymerase sigma-70 factor (ECF subfamily)
MNDESVAIVQRYREGDRDAASDLYARYVSRLIGLARSRLSSKMGQRVDAEDVVQSVFRSFFRGTDEGRFTFDESGDLWRLISSLTIHKILSQVEHHTRLKRSIYNEVSVCEDSVSVTVPIAFIADAPAPETALALIEELGVFTSGLSDRHREIFELRMQGRTPEQIAEHIGRSTRTVRRALELLHHELRQRLIDEVESTKPPAIDDEES